jgi:hypothetical protein
MEKEKGVNWKQVEARKQRRNERKHTHTQRHTPSLLHMLTANKSYNCNYDDKMGSVPQSHPLINVDTCLDHAINTSGKDYTKA